MEGRIFSSVEEVQRTNSVSIPEYGLDWQSRHSESCLVLEVKDRLNNGVDGWVQGRGSQMTVPTSLSSVITAAQRYVSSVESQQVMRPGVSDPRTPESNSRICLMVSVSLSCTTFSRTPVVKNVVVELQWIQSRSRKPNKRFMYDRLWKTWSGKSVKLTDGHTSCDT